MKVILQKDVKGLGRTHEAVEARDGYALNHLIPKKLAIHATPVATREAEGRLAKAGASKELDAKLLEQNIATLAETHITIPMKANEKGHLYNGIGADDIAEASSLPESAIFIDKPFKELGSHEVPVSYGENFGKFTLVIEAE